MALFSSLIPGPYVLQAKPRIPQHGVIHSTTATASKPAMK